MSLMSRNKGKTGERELARELARLFGCNARRGVQFCGGTDSPDVVTDIPGIHIECKRCETLSLYKAMQQAMSDAGDKVPTVMHRKNHKDWLVVLRLDDLPQLAQRLAAYLSANIDFNQQDNNDSKTND